MTNIARINAVARAAGLSYGQYQGLLHEAHTKKPQKLVEPEYTEVILAPKPSANKPKPEWWKDVILDVESERITKTRACEILGISRITLRRWTEQYYADTPGG